MLLAELEAATGRTDHGARVLVQVPSRVDLDELREGLVAWITECAGHPAIDAFPDSLPLAVVRDRLDELAGRVPDRRLGFELAETAGEVASVESECWLSLGLLVGAHLALRQPLDPARLAAYIEQVDAAVTAWAKPTGQPPLCPVGLATAEPTRQPSGLPTPA